MHNLKVKYPYVSIILSLLKIKPGSNRTPKNMLSQHGINSPYSALISGQNS